MNGTDYVTISKNCQHYVATILVELKNKSGYTSYYHKVMKVLGRKGEKGYEHIPNSLYTSIQRGAQLMALGIVTFEAVIIPSAGIWGFLGFTESVITVALLSNPTSIAIGAAIIITSKLASPQVVEHLFRSSCPPPQILEGGDIEPDDPFTTTLQVLGGDANVLISPRVVDNLVRSSSITSTVLGGNNIRAVDPSTVNPRAFQRKQAKERKKLRLREYRAKLPEST